MLDGEQRPVLGRLLSVHGLFHQSSVSEKTYIFILRQGFSMQLQLALASWVLELQTHAGVPGCIDHNTMKEYILQRKYSCDYKKCHRWLWPFLLHSPFSWTLVRVSRSTALCAFISIMGRKWWCISHFSSTWQNVLKQLGKEAFREEGLILTFNFRRAQYNM